MPRLPRVVVSGLPDRILAEILRVQMGNRSPRPHRRNRVRHRGEARQGRHASRSLAVGAIGRPPRQR